MVPPLMLPLALLAGTARLGAIRSVVTTKLQAASLNPVLDGDTLLQDDLLAHRLRHKRVALYFAAGWCPMCTRFEPSLMQFVQACEDSGKPVELVYVSSDKSVADQVARVKALNNMLAVPFDKAAAFKTKYRIWSGSETPQFGRDRRSGVPALVVLDRDGEELAFVAAEAQGVQALGTWPLNDEKGIWGKS